MNAFANPNLIAKEALRRLENNLVMAGLINRQYDEQFNGSGAKPGVTINIRKPPRYMGRTGAKAQIEGMSQPLVPLTIDQQFGLDLGYSSQQEALNLDSYSEQVIEPATAQIAQMVDSYLMGLAYQDVFNHVGTPGTVPNSLDVFIDAGVKLNNNAVPTSQRRAVVDALTEGGLVKGERVRFNPNKETSEMFRTGSFGAAAGFDFYMSQSVKKHQVGAYGGAPVINGAGQLGKQLVISGLTGVINKGDVFTIAGVNSVNPNTREDTGELQQFVATATTANNGTSISFEPEIITAGPYQTVTNTPGNGQAITVFATASTKPAQSLAFHKDFMTLACVDLYVPKGVDLAGRAQSKKRNLSIRFIRYYDGKEDQLVTRLDILCGGKVLRPEMACRVSGK